MEDRPWAVMLQVIISGLCIAANKSNSVGVLEVDFPRSIFDNICMLRGSGPSADLVVSMHEVRTYVAKDGLVLALYT